MKLVRTLLLMFSVAVATVVGFGIAGAMGWGPDGYLAFCVVAAIAFYATYEIRSRDHLTRYTQRIDAQLDSGAISKQQWEALSSIPPWQWGNGVGPVPNRTLALGLGSFGFFFATIPGFVAARLGYY